MAVGVLGAGDVLDFGLACERRAKPRVAIPFPVQVKGKDINGEEFELITTLDNLSVSGLYLRLNREVEEGAELSFVISLAPRGAGLRVVAQGKVVRRVYLPDGRCGIGVALINYRLSWKSERSK